MNKEKQYNGFAFYSTMLDMIESIEATDKELAYKVMKAIMDYGIYREYEADPAVEPFMAMVKWSIDKGHDKYSKSQAIGAKGGGNRKVDYAEIRAYLQETGCTYAKAADHFQTSTKTIQRAVAEGKEFFVEVNPAPTEGFFF